MKKKTTKYTNLAKRLTHISVCNRIPLNLSTSYTSHRHFRSSSPQHRHHFPNGSVRTESQCGSTLVRRNHSNLKNKICTQLERCASATHHHAIESMAYKCCAMQHPMQSAITLNQKRHHIFSGNSDLRISSNRNNSVCDERASLSSSSPLYSAMNARFNETSNLKLITSHKFDLNSTGIAVRAVE